MCSPVGTQEALSSLVAMIGCPLASFLISGLPSLSNLSKPFGST
ncbi:Protein of unknown function [Lactobacillus helveticus CIRM-BIA 101]|uniref:Uncharacterized protein n=2 Tax=Lactobacillus helveticus TaxID=1587 RepID=U6FC58_LACHE|nr:Protein of unknown function [Lactobacillus helveticus CIRM-BIA 951]CDI60121.1 Protein of unknown function [Lactobacillus helveticus CIRM-BIA 104]CDI62945.1 Protein of unknown function [Lactobacillus helveticus CIRM-BIA 103]CDI65628.1 Protein of unknown function [Lactobacillus helveticus CIRM-BIA 101]